MQLARQIESQEHKKSGVIANKIECPEAKNDVQHYVPPLRPK